MSVKIINKLSSPTLAMAVEDGIREALQCRSAEDWWVGVFEFGATQGFQVVLVGPGLAWNETFPKREGSLNVRGLMSYAVNSAIESLRFLKAADPTVSASTGATPVQAS